MLEVKNLVKQYSGKGGVSVKALDGVSVKFPETGMVFLLGRSGSGKSTLLNVAGGLDKPDGGEVIVKGRSSKNFSSADFDSYRNTFVGFVFQEYNILNEFSIEQNIALALQLQNKPNDKKAVNELLKLVDLDGYGKRKPNTLSGGQKQRVAIARALIKNPEIIMADEPTGALDSNTGKQVLDTLKKLSKEKLVIVVSHDREFAEYYGDRIIELKDGKILSDISKTYFAPQAASENVNLVGDDTITIKNAESLTEKDVKSIVSMLKKSGGEAVITASKNELKDVKRACKINDDGSRESFKNTEKVDIKEYDGKSTKFIKSHLPMGHAVKMGSSGLKGKPIRLIFTVLLSVVAFVMFGVVSTFMLYDSNYSITEAMKIAAYPNVMVGKYYDAVYESVKINNETGERTVTDSRDEKFATRFTPEEITAKNKAGLKFAGVFNFTNDRYKNDKAISVVLKTASSTLPVDVKKDFKNYYYVKDAVGFSDCGAAYIEENGFTKADNKGEYPADKNEVAIPEYIAELFVNTDGSGIEKSSDMVGKYIKISVDSVSAPLKVTAVYNVGTVPAKYDALKNLTTEIKEVDKENYNLATSQRDFIAHSFHTVLFVTEDFYDAYKGNIYNNNDVYIENEQVRSLAIEKNPIPPESEVENRTMGVFTEKTVSKNPNKFTFYDLDGTTKEFVLNGGEIYLNYNSCIRDTVNDYRNKFEEKARFDSAIKTIVDGDVYKDLVNDIYKGTNVETVFSSYLKVYYKTVAYKEYVYNAAKDLNEKAGYVKPTGFAAACDKVNNFISSDGQEPTAEEWNVLINAVVNDFKTELPQKYYYNLAQEMKEKNYSVFIDDLDSIVNQMQWSGASDEDFIRVRDFINENYATTTCKTLTDNITAEHFAVGVVSGSKTVHYKDKYGITGTLTVVGLFNLKASNSQDYLVSSAFIESHAIKDNRNEEYTWKSEYITDYVEPENAKYNFIVSVTNNSMEQVNAALESSADASYKINNGVYTELEYFLNLINRLRNIFFIVGAVVGVFAALMLLNFISVSISSKRKEIGILRAVGARGSDVFKIFFSEAFIIAIICFILATVGSFIVCYELNKSLADIVNMQLLDFNIINVGLILAISLGISIIATFFPVLIASKKSPVESIRAL